MPQIGCFLPTLGGDFRSTSAADSSAIVYSLVETAKANWIEPYDYLLMVLAILPYWGKNPAHKKLETLSSFTRMSKTGTTSSMMQQNNLNG